MTTKATWGWLIIDRVTGEIVRVILDESAARKFGECMFEDFWVKKAKITWEDK